MDKEALLQKRHDLLVRLNDSLQEEMIPSIITEPEEENAPEIVTVLLDEIGMDGNEAAAEFFFRPLMEDDDEVQYFACVITLLDELDEANLPTLYEAMSAINFLLPCGSFAVSIDKQTLAFRLTAPVSTEMGEDELYDEMNIVLGNALTFVDLYVDVLVDVAEGNATMEDVLEAL